MRDDLRAAFRSFKSSKTFTVVALLVLTLGIGASTAIFSVVDAVVLRGLPFDEHDRLVAVGERRAPGTEARIRAAIRWQLSSAAPQNYLDWAAAAAGVRVDRGDRRRRVYASASRAPSPRICARSASPPGSSTCCASSPRSAGAFTADERSRTAGTASRCSATGSGARRFGGGSRDRRPHDSARRRQLRGRRRHAARLSRIRSARSRPTDLWVPYVVPEPTSASAIRELRQHLPPDASPG